MAGYNYAGFVTALSEIAVVDPNETKFQLILPSVIEYADNRLYRELDLLNTVFRDSTFAFTALNRNVTLPSPSTSTTTGIFETTLGFNAITPVATQPDSGKRNPLVPVTRDFLDMAWPSTVGAGVPQFYAPITQTTFIVGPWPDAAYVLEVIGTIRPAPLSSTNTTTFLSQYLPDLYLAAACVFMFGYQRDFGGQSDDPQTAQSWETQYKTLFASASLEETRKRYAGPAWTSQSPAPAANPARN